MDGRSKFVAFLHFVKGNTVFSKCPGCAGGTIDLPPPATLVQKALLPPVCLELQPRAVGWHPSRLPHHGHVCISLSSKSCPRGRKSEGQPPLCERCF